MGRLTEQLSSGGGRLAQQVQQAPQPEKKSVGGFAKNVVKSGASLLGGIGSSLLNVFNPNMQKNTLANLADVGAGGLENLFTGGNAQSAEAQKFNAVTDFYKQRYGGVQNIKDTLYNDPVGAAADLSTVLTGGGAVIRGVGDLANVSRLARTGEILSTAGNVIDPINATGAAFNKVSNFGKARLAPKLEASSERLYQSALKPSKSLEAKNPNVIKAGLSERIPVSEKGYDQAIDRISKLNKEIKTKIEAGSKKGMTVDPKIVASRADEVKTRFSKQVAPQQDLAAIEQKRQDFLNHPDLTNSNGIPLDAAQEMKQGTYQQLKGKYGQERAAALETEKALARGLKDEIAKQIPEIADLNAKDSHLIGLEDALKDFVRRSGNSQLIGIGTPLAAVGGFAASGSKLGGLTLGLLKAAIDNPEIKSRLAIILSDAAKGKKVRTPRTTFGRALTPVSRLEPARNQDSQGL
jgi:predicted transcriptional regulator